jgi:uncharacterized OsmC-like protein
MSSKSVRTALDTYGRAIAENPQKARGKNSSATATLGKDLHFRISGANGETGESDMPRALGGGGVAPAPGWLLRAAVAACAGSAIAMRAAKQGIALRALEVTVESESDNRGMLGLDEQISPALSGLVVRVKIGGENAAAEDLRGLVQWADRHSPVGCTVREARPMRLEVEVLP